jgi:hypothetical protein
MAKPMIDIGLDEDEDLAIVSGDFTVVESTAQHQRQLILNNKGDFKQNPTIGVGVLSYLDDENYEQLIRAISIEFSRDGMDVKRVGLGKDGIIKSEAYYP